MLHSTSVTFKFQILQVIQCDQNDNNISTWINKNCFLQISWLSQRFFLIIIKIEKKETRNVEEQIGLDWKQVLAHLRAWDHGLNW